MALAPKFTQLRKYLTQGGVQLWLNQVFCDMGIHKQTLATIVISHVEAGYEVQISPSGTLWPDPVQCPAGHEIMLHGCNPFYLFDILQHGFLVSRGKGNYVGTWCTRWLHTALAYQQEMSWEGVSVTNAGPRVRVVLEVLADNSKRIKTYRGMRNKLTQ